MRARPILLLWSGLVALLAAFVSMTETGPNIQASFEPAGLLTLALLAPLFVAFGLGQSRGISRPLAGLSLAGAVFTFAFAGFLLGMRRFGDALGQLLTMHGSKTKILSFPAHVTMVASGVAALVSVTFLVWPEVLVTAVPDDDPAGP